MKTKQKIGLIGFGVVGTGLYQILDRDSKGLHPFELEKIAVRQKNKRRNFNKSLLSSAQEICNTQQIEVVVEAINDAPKAYEIALQTLRSGKGFITANKKMLAANLPELIALSREQQVPLLYEAAVCGSIPIIRNLEEYYSFHALTEIRGIVNGSTNYILDQMQRLQLDYQLALKNAQELGFAEKDPALDVEGHDASYKLQILILHAFGIFIENELIFKRGITDLGKDELQFATQHNLNIKLIASAKQNDILELTEAIVCPTLVNANHALSHVKGAQNAILVGDNEIGFQLFEGQGAGDLATGSALFNDLCAAQRGYQYPYKRGLTLQHQITAPVKKWVLGFHDNLTPIELFKSIEPLAIEKIGATIFVTIASTTQQLQELTEQYSFTLMLLAD
ncbi:MAG: homoserine dehydrogenase [Flavobacteriales bacterium]